MWIKDSCAGIGTISFYDNSNKVYGALGHGVCDNGQLFSVNSGEIVRANITSVSKSKNNNIGTLNGYFTNNSIGNIMANTPVGLFGKLSKKINKSNEIELGSYKDLKIGSATIYCTLSNNKVKGYKVEITEICNNFKNSNKNFVVKVTDKKLLKQTGGIVQGMSGSPIVQNNKLVGALTHVFVENCKEGYGILAENMIDKI